MMTALKSFSTFGTGYTGGDGREGHFVVLRSQAEGAYRLSSPTTSTLSEMFQPETSAERNTAAVRSSRFITQIGQIKMFTGYPWEKIADLLNCSRQSVYNWRDGLSITDANIRAVQRMHDAISFINRDMPVETRAVLEADDGAIYKMLKSGRHEDAKAAAGEGLGSKAVLLPGVAKELGGYQNHWTDRVVATSDERLENDGFPSRKVVGRMKFRKKT